MTSAAELESVFAAAFERSGMTRSRGTWRWSSLELTWLLELDRSPHADRFALDLGINVHSLPPAPDPERPTDCPILMHLENIPINADISRSQAIEALDLTSALPDAIRTRVLRSMADAVSRYVQATATESDLRSRLRAGDLRSAFVRKDVRAVLEGT